MSRKKIVAAVIGSLISTGIIWFLGCSNNGVQLVSSNGDNNQSVAKTASPMSTFNACIVSARGSYIYARKSHSYSIYYYSNGWNMTNCQSMQLSTARNGNCYYVLSDHQTIKYVTWGSVNPASGSMTAPVYNGSTVSISSLSASYNISQGAIVLWIVGSTSSGQSGLWKATWGGTWSGPTDMNKAPTDVAASTEDDRFYMIRSNNGYCYKKCANMGGAWAMRPDDGTVLADGIAIYQTGTPGAGIQGTVAQYLFRPIDLGGPYIDHWELWGGAHSNYGGANAWKNLNHNITYTPSSSWSGVSATMNGSTYKCYIIGSGNIVEVGSGSSWDNLTWSSLP